VTVEAWLVAALAASSVSLAMARPSRRTGRAPPTTPPGERDWVRRGRWWWAGSAGVAGWSFEPGWPGVLLGVVAGGFVHHLAVSAEPVARRREREQVRSDLPVLVLLLATTLRAGATPAAGVRRACAALPGVAAERLAGVSDRLALGIDPGTVWEQLAREPELATLGRTMARAQRSGAPVVATVERLADELLAAGRAELEDRARAVGVKAAVPLGVCLLPSFLLLGIVPMVVGLMTGLRL